VSDGAPGGSGGGLRGALARLGAGAVGLVRTRLELAALEFDEERRRALESVVLVLVAVLFFAFAVLAASALVVVWFWETQRIAALWGVTIAYVVIGVAALWRLSARRRTDARPFAATLAELERDRAWLAEQLGDDK
jgi:uncharacterized membrane protein YqjE